MNRIRTIIADDEPLARRGIRQLLSPHPDVAVVAETGNGSETVRALHDLTPDLLFLDVQMPGLDGFGVLRAVGEKHVPVVIFVTAYDEFAVRAFEAHALDYIVKPLEESRFINALERVRERLRSTKAVHLSRKLSAQLALYEKKASKQRILIPTLRGNFLIDAIDINWIEADDYYAAVHVHRGRYLIRESLASLEQRLDAAQFVRTHRSAIVNIDRVQELRKDGGEILLVMQNGVCVPVSRRRRSRLIELLRHRTSG